jgi:hypothetical protein
MHTLPCRLREVAGGGRGTGEARRLTDTASIAAALVGTVALPAAAADHHQPGWPRNTAVYISRAQSDSPAAATAPTAP